MSTFYVATDGNDLDDGAVDEPFATISKAASVAVPGDRIYLRGGTYNLAAQITIGAGGLGTNGTSGLPIRLYNYFGETPILDCTGFGDDVADANLAAIRLNADWWIIRGLIVQNGMQGFIIHGSNNILDRLTASWGKSSGFKLLASSRTHENNLYLNCDSHDNFDPWLPDPGNNADGFVVDVGLGTGNRFVGCRAWRNSDDGWDLINASNTLELESCWAFENGRDWFGSGLSFLGNGIKLSYAENVDDPPGTHPGWNHYHIVRRCMCWGNGSHGFMSFGVGPHELYNCVGWANGDPTLDPQPTSQRNFQFTSSSGSILRNNISFDAISNDQLVGVTESNNAWQGIGGTTATESDFLSLDDTIARGPRRPDGSLPTSNFLRLDLSSALRNVGADVGQPFVGTAPDLGAFEELSPLLLHAADSRGEGHFYGGCQ